MLKYTQYKYKSIPLEKMNNNNILPHNTWWADPENTTLDGPPHPLQKHDTRWALSPTSKTQHSVGPPTHPKNTTLDGPSHTLQNHDTRWALPPTLKTQH